MKLTEASIVNFRAIGDLQIQFDRSLTVLVGDNATGKTCSLSAIRIGLSQVTSFFGDALIEPQVGDLRCLRGGMPMAASVTLSGDELSWSVRASPPPKGDPMVSDWSAWDLTDYLARIRAARRDQGLDVPLPIVAHYGVERGGRPSASDGGTHSKHGSDRTSAWRGALRTTTRYDDLYAWFNEAEVEELRKQRDGVVDWRSSVLDAVRSAVGEVMANASNMRISPDGALTVLIRNRDRTEDEVDLDSLSGGYRSLLSLVADLAYRMALANPTIGRHSEAIVLIDEVDLHLHPRWQQTVLDDLRRAFPNTQFIVTTHSEQVIASALPGQVVRLDRDPEWGVVASQPASTYGATPDRIVEDVMGLAHLRPPAVEDVLTRYWAFIRDGEGESPGAQALRATLDGWFRGQDPEMIRADAEIRRQKFLRRPGGVR